MNLAERIRERMAVLGLSQSDLAREVGLSQPGISALLTRNKTGTKKLDQIAQALRTTPAYLRGDIHDPDEGAPARPPEPNFQLVPMSVALPDEDALARAFEGLLLASEQMERAELARELARRLPTLLAVARLPRRPSALATEAPVEDDGQSPALAPRAQRRA